MAERAAYHILIHNQRERVLSPGEDGEFMECSDKLGGETVALTTIPGRDCVRLEGDRSE